MISSQTHVRRHLKQASTASTLGALGVVFGDIGTSPLYCLTAAFADADEASATVVYGITSMVIWTVTAIVTILYVTILLRFDNHHEGGILALFARIRRARPASRTLTVATALAMVGTGMFLGDGVITPAISVLSAVEGARLVDPGFAQYVVPLTLAILGILFAIQHAGTDRIGALFGPIMMVWFAACAVLGAASLARTPAALTALSPHWIARLVADYPWTAFLALGSVVLAVTGAEALFADMGHFGRATIARAWFAIVYPALVIGYLGQAAAVLRSGANAASPFFAMAPPALVLPLAVLATIATVIASQAVISGAYSVVQQAGRLGVLPRLRTIHTSARTPGQIYVPSVNAALGLAVLAVVIVFRRSGALASAYGIAVTMTIMTTAALLLVLLSIRPRSKVLRGVVAVLLALSASYVAGNVTKIPTGGWLPVALGSGLCVVMWAWFAGESRLSAAKRAQQPDLAALLPQLRRARQVPGTIVFLADSIHRAPGALLAMLHQYGVVPARLVILHVHTSTAPYGCRLSARDLAPGITTVEMEFGYREPQHVARTLTNREHELGQVSADDIRSATYFLTVNIPVLTPGTGMPQLLGRLYILLKRFSLTRADAFHLPVEATTLQGRELTI